ncbi:hypothetical protein MANY_53770 [Mycolicibacterium anyangense]|uniref:Protein CR006 P-loop domain-containing protein n=1 Tax=Mycolicibacterium anyangense TaxID=1431246 RepID=A0A6N4WDH0_9MYCO|nr:AAA family ATPase [Mycolicibacterium anyangense]BBZ80040.1 hypothetical protein MANY_53770 [Mycolicibacterium anyangense]
MLRRLERIKACGIFEDFRWDLALPELARITVIFGRNGTGKTSLAGALDGLRYAADGMGFSRVSLALEDASGTRVTSFSEDPAFDRIHVFSERYVSRSHRFTPAAADMDAVLTVGHRPVDAEQRLEVLRQLVATKTAERDSAAGAELSAKQQVEETYRQVSKNVVDAAGRAGGRWNSKSNFSARVVKTEFAASHCDWRELTEGEMREKVGIINSDRLEALAEPSLPVAVPSDLVERLSPALSATPSTIVLDTLAEHPEATPWVDAGRRLHEEAPDCIFCGSKLTDERKAQIDRHFSDEVEELQRDLQSIARELDEAARGIDRLASAIPSKGLFIEDLRPRFDDAVDDLRVELSALQQWIDVMRDRVKAKADNVISQVDSAVDAPPVVVGSALASLLRQHNIRVESHETFVKQAALDIERHYLKQAEATVRAKEQIAASKNAEVAAFDAEMGECYAEIAALERVEGDPMPSAKVLTEEVARLLGRNELRFEAADGRYKVLRFGQPAIGLSVGERTAITLVHFLESVARFDATNGKPIVVIDDPVSSLDSDIFMGVSTYIWTEMIVKDHIAQLILLTHDFELFRQWDIQIDRLHQRGGRDPATGQKFTELYPAQFYEIRSRHSTFNGHTRRRPTLASWPPSESSRKKIRSSYHHAFICVAQALCNLANDDSLENRLDAQLLFPNVVRRMLETFLAFKRPEWVGDFNSAMRNSTALLDAAGYRGDSNALRLRLTRYANSYSHDEDPSTDKTVNPDEVSTAIRAVFEFMNQLDEGHFRGLCDAVGINPNELLPQVPAVMHE